MVILQVAVFIVVGLVVGVAIGLGVKMWRQHTLEAQQRRVDMLASLQASSDTIKTMTTLKKQNEDYKFRLAAIAKRHVDSDDVPGYCAVDDEAWPCATANLANLRKNAKLVE